MCLKLSYRSLLAKLKYKTIVLPIDSTAAIICLIFALIMLYYIEHYIKVSEGSLLDSRFFPRFTMYLLISASLYLIVYDIYKLITKRQIRYKTFKLYIELKLYLAFIIIAISVALAYSFNFFLVAALFCSIALLSLFKCQKISYYVIICIFCLIVHSIFNFILKVNF